MSESDIFQKLYEFDQNHRPEDRSFEEYGRIVAEMAQEASQATNDPVLKKFYNIILEKAVSLADRSLTPEQTASTFKKMLGLVSANEDSFSHLQRRFVQTVIGPVILDFQTGDKAIQKEISKNAFEGITPYLFFKTIHICGLVTKFEEGLEKNSDEYAVAMLPRGWKRLYPDWKKKNAAFVNKYAEINAVEGDTSPLENQLDGLVLSTESAAGSRSLKSVAEEMRQTENNTKDPVLKKFYGLIREALGSAKTSKEAVTTWHQRIFSFVATTEAARNIVVRENVRFVFAPIFPDIVKEIGGKHNLMDLTAPDLVPRMDILAEIPPHDIFRAIHACGLAKQFEELLADPAEAEIPRFFPDYPQQYAEWKLQNPEFIEKWAKIAGNDLDGAKSLSESFQKPFADATDEEKNNALRLAFEVTGERATNPAAQKLYNLLSTYLNAGPDDPLRNRKKSSWYEKVFELLSEHPDSFGPEEKNSAAGFIEVLFPLMMKERRGDILPPDKVDILVKEAKKVLKDMPKDPLFRAMHICGIETVFANILTDRAKAKASNIPGDYFPKYQEWKNKNKQFVQDCIDRNRKDFGEGWQRENYPELEFRQIAETESKSSSQDYVAALPHPEDPRVTHIRVDHPLVVNGNNEGMGYKDVTEDDSIIPDRPKDDSSQNRTQTLVDALLADPQSSIRHITVRWDVHHANENEKPSRPYNLLDVQMTDGSLSRIAVCDYYGHMTFVRREASSWKDTECLQVSNLRKDPKVWTSVHVTDKQWVSSIQEILYTPMDQLTPESKSRSYWSSLKGVLMESFAATIVHTGKVPSLSDKTPISYGPLAGDENRSWYKAYHILQKKSVRGLELATTFNRLVDACASYPYKGLKEFLNRPANDNLDAASIQRAAEFFKQEWGEDLAPDYYDIFSAAGYSGYAIDLAFQFGAVTGLDKALPAEAKKPENLAQFLVTAKAAQEQNVKNMGIVALIAV